MRESKMLERVRQWRAEAYEALRRESEAARRQRTHDWVRRLNLPMLDEGEDTDQGVGDQRAK